MATTTFTATLPDGTTESRKTGTMPYTHATVVQFTQAHKDAMVAKWEANLAKDKADLEAMSAPTDEDKAERDALHATYEATSVSNRVAYDAASKAYWGCKVVKHNQAVENVARSERALANAQAIKVGECFVKGWSMNANNAGKMAQGTAKDWPLCNVTIVDAVATHVSKPRGSKAKPEQAEAIQAASEDTGAELPKHPLAGVVPPVQVAEPPTVSCPKCKASCAKLPEAIDKLFGFRKMAGKQFRQSYCRTCRGQSPKAVEAPKEA